MIPVTGPGPGVSVSSIGAKFRQDFSVRINGFHEDLLESHGFWNVFRVWRPQKWFISRCTNLKHGYYQIYRCAGFDAKFRILLTFVFFSSGVPVLKQELLSDVRNHWKPLSELSFTKSWWMIHLPGVPSHRLLNDIKTRFYSCYRLGLHKHNYTQFLLVALLLVRIAFIRNRVITTYK